MSGYLKIYPVGNSIDVAAARLAGVKGGIDKALYNAGKRAGDKLKAEASRRARERYAISAGNISGNAPKIKVQSGGGSSSVSVQWNGTRFALSKFNGSSNSPAWDKSRLVRVKKSDGENARWITTHPGKEGKGHVLKNTSPMTISGSFVAQFSSGHAGIFHRTGGTTGGGNEEIEESMGLSVPQMVGSDAIKDEVGEVAVEEFDTRLAHEVNRLLGLS